MEISVIVPTLNEEKNIERCLKSISKQTLPRSKYEIVISDTYSTDKTIKIAKKYADKIVMTRKRGLWYGRNFGARYAKGKYFVFIDADTSIDRDYLNAIYACFEKGYLGVSTSFRFSGRSLGIKITEGILTSYYALKSFLHMDHLLGFNICVSRKGMELTGGFRNLTLEDTGMADDLKKFGRIKYISQKLVTTSSRRLEEDGIIRTFKYYIDLWLVQKLNLRPGKNGFVKHGSFEAFTDKPKGRPNP